MYLAILLISMLLMLYGAVRFVVAKWRQEENPAQHILWIAGSAFFYAASIAVITWVFQ